jgi:hypothetical protein
MSLALCTVPNIGDPSCPEHKPSADLTSQPILRLGSISAHPVFAYGTGCAESGRWRLAALEPKGEERVVGEAVSLLPSMRHGSFVLRWGLLLRNTVLVGECRGCNYAARKVRVVQG